MVELPLHVRPSPRTQAQTRKTKHDCFRKGPKSGKKSFSFVVIMLLARVGEIKVSLSLSLSVSLSLSLSLSLFSLSLTRTNTHQTCEGKSTKTDPPTETIFTNVKHAKGQILHKPLLSSIATLDWNRESVGHYINHATAEPWN